MTLNLTPSALRTLWAVLVAIAVGLLGIGALYHNMPALIAAMIVSVGTIVAKRRIAPDTDR